jgi:hypothetical protein
MERSFLVEFRERRTQVKRYLAVVAKMERELSWKKERQPHSNNRLNVLRAGTFLILYNMIESAARLSVQAIHDDMLEKRISFSQLRRSLRRAVVLGFKRRGNPDLHQDMKNVPLELVTAALDVDEHFSGNVDAKRIREIAELYGFSHATAAVRTRDGADLLTIKTIRNDLAHGTKTYEQVGRDYPIRELLGLSLRATVYIAEILTNVGSYLDNERFLEQPEDRVA